MQLRELLLSPSCGLLLGLNGLWKCASQQSGAQDTLADVIDVLRLACADGPSGGFAAQIVGMQDSLAGIMKVTRAYNCIYAASGS